MTRRVERSYPLRTTKRNGDATATSASRFVEGLAPRGLVEVRRDAGDVLLLVLGDAAAAAAAAGTPPPAADGSDDDALAVAVVAGAASDVAVEVGAARRLERVGMGRPDSSSRAYHLSALARERLDSAP